MIVDKLLKRVTMLILIASLATLVACADERQQRGGGKQGGGQQGPPPEAYTACEGKAAGDTVSITSPQGETLTATCTMINSKLAAVPEGQDQR
jgi:hypothetical protein